MDAARLKQYNDFMNLPHQRPAYGVNAPGIFRHIGFRISGDEGDPLRATEYEESRRLRAAYISALDAVLESVQGRCKAKKIYTFAVDGRQAPAGVVEIDPRNSLLSELHPADVVGFDELASWRIRLRADIHTEYYYITLILDQSTRDLDLDAEAPAGLAGSAKIACDHELRLSSRQAWTEGEVTQLVDFFYEEVWEKVDAFLGTKFQDLVEKRFTEFRSIALRDLGSKFFQKKRTAPATFVVTDESEFEESLDSLHKWVNHNGDVVRGILKFNQLTRKTDLDANCVLCEMLDGGAIYGSSLGQFPSPEDSLPSPTQAAPLRYFIVYNDLSKYQLGRIVRRTHAVGELRMAAAFDIEKVSRASVKIQTLGNYIDNLTSAPALTAKASSPTTLDEAQLKKIRSVLYEISSSGIPGGLAYRVARSRHYVSAFENRVFGMRIRKLEGWEPYDLFVRRKLSQVFGFIGGVGSRYEALSERVHRMTTAHNAERLNTFQDEVGALVTEMKEVNEDILGVQVLGEAIGVIAFAYYGSHIVADIIHTVRAACTTCDPLPKEQEHFIMLLSVVVALLFLYPFWKLWERARLPQLEEARRIKRAAARKERSKSGSHQSVK